MYYLHKFCEPSPMCLGAIYWTFCKHEKSAAMIGFDDEFIYQEIDLPNNKRKLITEQILAEVAQRAFNLWNRLKKIKY